MHTIPGKPRGRGKEERAIKTIQQKIIPSLPGYLGGPNPKRWHRDDLLSRTELEERIRVGLQSRYSSVIHRATGEAPLARYEQHRNERCNPATVLPNDELALRPYDVRVKQLYGIHFANGNYWGPGLDRVPRGSAVRVYREFPSLDRVELTTHPLVKGPIRSLGYAERICAESPAPDPKRQAHLAEAAVSPAAPRASQKLLSAGINHPEPNADAFEN